MKKTKSCGPFWSYCSYVRNCPFWYPQFYRIFCYFHPPFLFTQQILRHTYQLCKYPMSGSISLVCKNLHKYIKFIYSEKATKFCEISTLLLSYVMPVKSKVENSQNFVAFSEYLNFNRLNQNSVSMQVVKSNLDEIRYIFPLLTEFAFTPFNSKSWNQQDLKQY